MIVFYSFHFPFFNPCSKFSDLSNCVGNQHMILFNIETIKTFPIILLSFSCQQNTFAIINELQMPTENRINSIITFSNITAFVLYSTAAICGYYTFGDNLKPDILTMYPGLLLLL